ncbi:hypothetical protein SAMN04488078_11491, partial [Antarctobacter heliothermus]
MYTQVLLWNIPYLIFAYQERKQWALLRKGWLRDSSRESSVVAVLHEQTDPAEL